MFLHNALFCKTIKISHATGEECSQKRSDEGCGTHPSAESTRFTPETYLKSKRDLRQLFRKAAKITHRLTSIGIPILFQKMDRPTPINIIDGKSP